MTSFVFSAQRSSSISGLYVFGDSLSDVGMVFHATGETYPPDPPYFQGRYSNGRVWVEYLADRLQLSSRQTQNYAYGGATTGRDRSGLVPGLLAQVQSFAQAHRENDANALYVLWAGANDYLQGVSNTNAPVENIALSISALANVGVKKMLVANLPDLGQLPATRSSSSSKSLSALTQTHNQNLRRSLKLLTQQHSDLQITVLDANALYREAIATPSAFGFTNVVNACVSGSGICGNPDQFLFWDQIHPTTSAHRVLAERAFSALGSEQLTAAQTVRSP